MASSMMPMSGLVGMETSADDSRSVSCFVRMVDCGDHQWIEDGDEGYIGAGDSLVVPSLNVPTCKLPC